MNPQVIRYGQLVITIAKTGPANYEILLEAEGPEDEINVSVGTPIVGEDKAFQL